MNRETFSGQPSYEFSMTNSPSPFELLPLPALKYIASFLNPRDTFVLDQLLGKNQLGIITNDTWRCWFEIHHGIKCPPNEDSLDYKKKYFSALVKPEMIHFEQRCPLFFGSHREVFLVVKKLNGKALAVKHYAKKEIALNAPHFERVRNETHSLEALGNHENVLKLLGKFQTNLTVCLLFDYYPNRDLFTFMDLNYPHGLPDEKFFSIALGILSGLQYLHHSCFIVHGDLKPENILIDGSCRPVIADYSHCLRFSSLEQGTVGRICVFSGTPSYMAHEYLAKSVRCFDSDIWSLGCTLYFMKTFKLLFCGSIIDIYQAIENLRPSNPLSLVGHPGIECLITSLISPLPELRPDFANIRNVIGLLYAQSRSLRDETESTEIEEYSSLDSNEQQV